MLIRINSALDASRAKREEGEKGFTLIELLVVVIIIGILAAIAIPVFLNQRESAWRASVESDLKNAATSIETYAASQNGSYTGIAAVYTEGVTAIGTSTVSISVSDNNTLTVTLTGNDYVISGVNSDLGAAALEYQSANGGLQDW